MVRERTELTATKEKARVSGDLDPKSCQDYYSRRQAGDFGAMRRSVWLLAATVAVATTSASAAPAFDTCILDHMQGVTSDLAAIAVKEACIRATEEPLPDAMLQTLMSARAWYEKLPMPDETEMGLYIRLNNNSGFRLTELVVRVTNIKTQEAEDYVVRRFPYIPPPGSFFSGPPPDRTVEEIIGPGNREFFLTVNQKARDTQSWGATYSWDIVSAKGLKD
jgi:hypothetical protein